MLAMLGAGLLGKLVSSGIERGLDGAKDKKKESEEAAPAADAGAASQPPEQGCEGGGQYARALGRVSPNEVLPCGAESFLDELTDILDELEDRGKIDDDAAKEIREAVRGAIEEHAECHDTGEKKAEKKADKKDDDDGEGGGSKAGKFFKGLFGMLGGVMG